VYLTTLLSKKYNPVIAKLDKYFFGFSIIFIILIIFNLFYYKTLLYQNFILQILSNSADLNQIASAK